MMSAIDSTDERYTACHVLQTPPYLEAKIHNSRTYRTGKKLLLRFSPYVAAIKYADQDSSVLDRYRHEDPWSRLGELVQICIEMVCMRSGHLLNLYYI
jgi:hypothetical protein